MREARLAERLSSLLLIIATAGALAFLYVLNPSTSTLYPTCPFLAVTGCYCPGCGSLRALHHLMRGHLQTAFGLNPLLVLSLPFVGYSFASHAALAFLGRSLRGYFLRPILIWTLLGIIILYWVLRNLPTYPFTLLAP